MAFYTLAQIRDIHGDGDGLAKQIVSMYETYNNQRRKWLEEKQELRNFVFATDASSTSSSSTPWKNKTTLPKLCQIRDSLHANYEAALFPNDDWLRWEGYTQEDATREKREVIQAYMSNKTREGGFRQTISQLLYDYIDGAAFADVIWVNETKVDPHTNEKIPGYIGPKVVRISPTDHVFDPTATDYRQSPKITRSLIRVGELIKMNQDWPELWLDEAVNWAKEVRTMCAATRKNDMDRALSYAIDGFGNLAEYYGSGIVELLEFEGTIYDDSTGEVYDDYIITVLDRNKVVRCEPVPSWKRGGMKEMATWRKRPDNLYGMGPLDNLVGIQYRIDHLENAKADAWDLVVTPMFKIKGNVEDFEFRPGGQVAMDEQGDIMPLGVPDGALSANTEIAYLMSLMEEFSGTTKPVMGIPTPGEKTAFEVQSLDNAANRMFQQKITQFEIEMLEPLLNNMLLLAVKNMGDGTDVVRALDNDLGVVEFLEITKEDITAAGVLRPIGARHFSSRAQLLQNLTGVANGGLWPKIERHFSDTAMAQLIEDVLQLNRFSLYGENAAIYEQAETQRIAQTAQEQLATEAATPVEGDMPEGIPEEQLDMMMEEDML